MNVAPSLPETPVVGKDTVWLTWIFFTGHLRRLRGGGSVKLHWGVHWKSSHSLKLLQDPPEGSSGR